RGHAIPEIVERALVGVGGAFEVQADLQPALSGVVPDLVVELGMSVVELCEASVAAADFEFPQLRRQLRLDALAQPGEEVRWRHRGSPCQRLEYISYSFDRGFHPDRHRERGRQPRALLRHLLAPAQGPYHPHRTPPGRTVGATGLGP